MVLRAGPTIAAATFPASAVSAGQLIGDAQMDLSAMTAQARLQQRGYTVNPF